MTSRQGSPYTIFKRALARGSLTQILAAAADLPHIALDDALAVCHAMQGHEQAERAAVRWLGRFALERPSVRLEDLRTGLAAFEALPYNPDGARRALDDLCRQHGVATAPIPGADPRAHRLAGYAASQPNRRGSR